MHAQKTLADPSSRFWRIFGTFGLVILFSREVFGYTQDSLVY